MLLRKHQGGSSVGPYTWAENGDVCEVPDDLAADLLRLGGYSHVEAEITEPAPEAKVTEPAPKDEHEITEAPARRGGRKPRTS